MLKDRIGLGYKSVDTDFFRPALMGDRLNFTVLIEHVGRTSIIYSVHCVREVEEIMRCRLVMVTTSLNTHNAINIPPDLKDALSRYRDMCR
jgi:4-hydroxybenzoyl-CoA thioesterase